MNGKQHTFGGMVVRIIQSHLNNIATNMQITQLTSEGKMEAKLTEEHNANDLRRGTKQNILTNTHIYRHTLEKKNEK